MCEQELRGQLKNSFKNRAILYYFIYDELSREIGAENAEKILKRAIYRRGEQIGAQFQPHAPADFEGLRDAFLAVIPDQGRMFNPDVVRCDAEGLDVQLEACPLKAAWEEMGLDQQQREALCRIAGEIDKGTFEAAGFGFEPDTWQPGRSGCCHLHIRRMPDAGASQTP